MKIKKKDNSLVKSGFNGKIWSHRRYLGMYIMLDSESCPVQHWWRVYIIFVDISATRVLAVPKCTKNVNLDCEQMRRKAYTFYRFILKSST